MPVTQTLAVSGSAAAGSTFLGATQDHIQALWQAAVLPAGGIGGTASAYTATVVPAPASGLVQGMGLYFRAHLVNASGATLNLNGGGAVPIYRRGGVAIVAGDLQADEEHFLVYRVAAGSLPNRWVVLTLPSWGGAALPIAAGGTGATTASAARTALALQSMALQAASAVAITGGTAVLSTLTASASMILGGAAAVFPSFYLDAPTGNARQFIASVAGVNRWAFRLGNEAAETGGDAGTNVVLTRFNDAGTAIDAPFSIIRATGMVGLKAIDVADTIGIASTTVINATRIPILRSYTVATLPSASANARGLIYVSDGTANKRLAISDGTNWRWPDGAIVS